MSGLDALRQAASDFDHCMNPENDDAVHVAEIRAALAEYDREEPPAEPEHCPCEDHLQAALTNGCRCYDHVHDEWTNREGMPEFGGILG